MMTNADRLETLTLAEMRVYASLLANPMLDNRELAELRGCSVQTLKNHLSKIYAKLIPEDIYNRLAFTKLRLYVLLNYDERFHYMPDSWRATFIDPMFSTKE